MNFDAVKFASVFETLSSAVKTELDAQFVKKRIIGSEYANAYSQLMDTVLKLAYNDQLLQKDSELKEEAGDMELKVKAALIRAHEADISLKMEQQSDLTAQRSHKVALLDAQTGVYIRQKEGFDENAQQKMLEIQLNSWGLAFSAGMINTVPDVIKNANAKVLYEKMIQRYGLTLTTTANTA